MEPNSNITRTAKEIADNNTDYILDTIRNVVDWSDVNFSGDDYALIEALAAKIIAENILEEITLNK